MDGSCWEPPPLLLVSVVVAVSVSGGCEGDGVVGDEEDVEAILGGFIVDWIGGLAGTGEK